MGMSILTDSDKTEAVIVNDSVLPAYPLGMVFSVYDKEGLEGEDILDLVNEFIDWSKPMDIRYIYTDALRIRWGQFLSERQQEGRQDD